MKKVQLALNSPVGYCNDTMSKPTNDFHAVLKFGKLTITIEEKDCSDESLAGFEAVILGGAARAAAKQAQGLNPFAE